MAGGKVGFAVFALWNRCGRANRFALRRFNRP